MVVVIALHQGEKIAPAQIGDKKHHQNQISHEVPGTQRKHFVRLQNHRVAA
jgi:hypothetical protein